MSFCVDKGIEKQNLNFYGLLCFPCFLIRWGECSSRAFAKNEQTKQLTYAKYTGDVKKFSVVYPQHAVVQNAGIQKTCQDLTAYHQQSSLY